MAQAHTSQQGLIRRPIIIIALFMLVMSSIAAPLHFWPYGDSITGSFSGNPSYRYYLWRFLIDAGYEGKIDFVGQYCGVGDIQDPSKQSCGAPLYPGTEWDWDHGGYHGRDTDEQIDALLPGIVSLFPVDLVFMLHGANDALRGTNPDTTKANLSAMIDMIRDNHPGVVIFLAKLIPNAAQPERTDSINVRIEELVAEKQLEGFGLYLVEQPEGFNPNRDCDYTGYHPVQSGEYKMGVEYFKAVRPVLDSISTISVKMTAPTDRLYYSLGETIHLEAIADANVGVSEVDFYAGDQLLAAGARTDDSIFSLQWEPDQAGVFEITAKAYNSIGSADISSVHAIAVLSDTTAQNKTIMEIQGPAQKSPIAEQRVRTEGIVTHKKADEPTFWIQSLTPDGLISTSDGIKVTVDAYGGVVPEPRIGDHLCVSGIVRELDGSPEWSVTTLDMVSSISVYSSNNQLPQALAIPRLPRENLLLATQYWEWTEGMLIKINNAKVVAPTEDNGEFVVTTGNGVAPGSGYTSYFSVLTPNAIALDSVDYNPERIMIAPGALSAPQLSAGDNIVQVVGITDYDNGMYKIRPIIDSLVIGDTQAIPQSPVAIRTGYTGATVRITSFDLENLVDTVDSYNKSDSVLNTDELEQKIYKIAKAIKTELALPDILVLQGIEHESLLQDVKAALNGCGVNYTIVCPEAEDHRGLQQGFMVNQNVVRLTGSYHLTRTGVDSVALDNAFGTGTDWAVAKPLIGTFMYNLVPFTIVNIDLIDKSSDDPVFTSNFFNPVKPSEAKRDAQAIQIRNYLNSLHDANPNAVVMVAGDLNDYPFAEKNDGEYPFAILKGNGAEVPYTDVQDYLYEEMKFTRMIDGNAQNFHHVFLSPAMNDFLHGVDILHINSLYPSVLSSDTSHVIGCSKADPIELRF